MTRLSAKLLSLPREVPATSWIHPLLTVGPSSIDGRGVISSAALAKGTEVIVWGGQVFTRVQVLSGLGRQHTLVGISDELLLGNPQDQPLSTDDYMNHSCAPNVGMADEITLVATREIGEGEELVADYAIWLNDEKYVMKQECHCGAVHCRRVIRGTDWRLPQVQDTNRGYFSPFVARRIVAEIDL